MIRTASLVALSAAFAASVLSALDLAEALSQPVASPVSNAAPVTASVPLALSTAPARTFAPIYGTPAPQAQVTAQALAPAPVRPDFTLRGAIATPTMRYAFLDGAEGVQVVRVGDSLAPGITVAGIASDHVILDVAGSPLTLAFVTTDPQHDRTTPGLAVAQTSAPPLREMVRSVTMTQDEVFALVAAAQQAQGAATR